GARGAQVVGGAVDRVDRVVAVAIPVPVPVDTVAPPGRGEELHGPAGAGGVLPRRDPRKQRAPEVALYLVDRRQDRGAALAEAKALGSACVVARVLLRHSPDRADRGISRSARSAGERARRRPHRGDHQDPEERGRRAGRHAPPGALGQAAPERRPDAHAPREPHRPSPETRQPRPDRRSSIAIVSSPPSRRTRPTSSPETSRRPEASGSPGTNSSRRSRARSSLETPRGTRGGAASSSSAKTRVAVTRSSRPTSSSRRPTS